MSTEAVETMTMPAEIRHRELALLGIEVRGYPHPGQKYTHGWKPLVPTTALAKEILSDDDAARDYGDELDRVDFTDDLCVVARSEGTLTIQSAPVDGKSEIHAAPSPAEAEDWASAVEAMVEKSAEGGSPKPNGLVDYDIESGLLVGYDPSGDISVRWIGEADGNAEDLDEYDGFDLSPDEADDFVGALRDMAYTTEDHQNVPEDDEDPEADTPETDTDQSAGMMRHRTLALLGIEVRDFNPELHPRNPKGSVGGGRFRSLGDRIVDALKGGGDDPLAGFSQPQLKKAATDLGLNPPKGMRLVPLKALIMAHGEKHVPEPAKAAKKAAKKAAPHVTPGLPSDPNARAQQIDDRIHTAVADLAQQPGGWVPLADLRERLGADIPRREVDAALVRLNRQPGVRVIPEANQKSLTQRDWDAAVEIGNQPKHLIAVEPPQETAAKLRERATKLRDIAEGRRPDFDVPPNLTPDEADARRRADLAEADRLEALAKQVESDAARRVAPSPVKAAKKTATPSGRAPRGEKETPAETVAKLEKATSRDQAREILAGKTTADLKAVASEMGASHITGTKPRMVEQLAELTGGAKAVAAAHREGPGHRRYDQYGSTKALADGRSIHDFTTGLGMTADDSAPSIRFEQDLKNLPAIEVANRIDGWLDGPDGPRALARRVDAGEDVPGYSTPGHSLAQREASVAKLEAQAERWAEVSRRLHASPSPSPAVAKAPVAKAAVPKATQAEIDDIVNSGISDAAKSGLLGEYGVPESEWPEHLRPKPPAPKPPSPTDAERKAAGYGDPPDGIDPDRWDAMSYHERLQALVAARPTEGSPAVAKVAAAKPPNIRTKAGRSAVIVEAIDAALAGTEGNEALDFRLGIGAGTNREILQGLRDRAAMGEPDDLDTVSHVLDRLAVRLGVGSDDQPSFFVDSPRLKEGRQHKREALEAIGRASEVLKAAREGRPLPPRATPGGGDPTFQFNAHGLTASLDRPAVPDADGRIRAGGQVRDGDGQIVGSFHYTLDPATRSAVIDSVGIAPEHQGRGFTTSFAAHVEGQLRQQGYSRIGLDAAYGGGAFWARRGYGWDPDSPGAFGDVPARMVQRIANDPNGPDAPQLRAWVDRFRSDDRANWPSPREIVESGPLGAAIMDGASWKGVKSLSSPAARKVAAAKKATPRAPKTPTLTPAEHVAALRVMDSREAAIAHVAGLRGKALDDALRAAGLPVVGPVAQKRVQLVEHTVGFRLNSQTIRGGSWSGGPGGAGPKVRS